MRPSCEQAPARHTSVKTPAIQGDTAEGLMGKERQTCLGECCKRGYGEYKAAAAGIRMQSALPGAS